MHHRRTIAALLLAAATLLGCASPGPERPALYDFGPLPVAPSSAASARQPLPPLSIAGISAPSWLDSTRMFYRLNYDNPQQAHAYAYARWTMAPSQLLLQRLKSRIVAAGGVALPASQGAADVPVLRIEADDFSQVFASQSVSRGRVSLRASVYRGRVLVAHRAFSSEAAAPAANAAGGAAALATAGDAVIGDLIAWLGMLEIK